MSQGAAVSRDRRGAGRAVRAAAVFAAAALLIGCAQIPPVAGWSPPGWSDASGARLVRADEPSAGDEDPGSGEHPDAGAAPVGGGPSDAIVPSAAELGFIERRVRNDHTRFHARYVEIPGWHLFNVRVSDLLAQQIAATGGTFTPEVFPVAAGLSDAGCVPGSASWPGERLLADPETAPVDGAGVTAVCDVTAAFGAYVGVAMRVVAGDSSGVARDRTVTLYTDLATGEVYEDRDLWTAEAAGELWHRAAELLRRDVGGLSAAPLAEPGEDQLALAQRALEAAQLGESGARFTLPAGIAAPELAGLGVEATSGPTVIDVDAATVSGWTSELGSAMHAQRGAPFVGLPEWSADQAVDCRLLACVAVTYDDGPSAYTGQLLDTLREERSAATFFMVGRSIRSLPEVAQRVASEGHEIASHTMTHPDLTTLSLAKARREVRDVEKLLGDLTGRTVGMYRPPYGALNQKVLDGLGQPAILWSIDTLDWKKPGREELVKRSVGVAEPGDIILFHDIHAETVDNAGVVIRGLRDRGFTLVSVTQLFDGNVPKGRVSKR
ncbi:polysaccharide deacetylase family protein [Leucobacter sp.]